MRGGDVNPFLAVQSQGRAARESELAAMQERFEGADHRRLSFRFVMAPFQEFALENSTPASGPSAESKGRQAGIYNVSLCTLPVEWACACSRDGCLSDASSGQMRSPRSCLKVPPVARQVPLDKRGSGK